MTLSELRNRGNEVFSSIIIFCPDFPPAAQTTTGKKFEQLTAIIDRVLEKVRSDDAKKWLQICLQEAQQSRKHYEEGDRRRGVDLIQRAEEHFKQAFSKEQTAPRFVVGEQGSVQDTDAGFPQ